MDGQEATKGKHDLPQAITVKNRKCHFTDGTEVLLVGFWGSGFRRAGMRMLKRKNITV